MGFIKDLGIEGCIKALCTPANWKVKSDCIYKCMCWSLMHSGDWRSSQVRRAAVRWMEHGTEDRDGAWWLMEPPLIAN